MTDPRDPICERLGDLAARVAPGDERLPDARAWARIGQGLDRRGSWRSPRRLVPVLALCLALAAIGAGALVARRPLDYRVQGCERTFEGAACAATGSLAFSDGTQVSLDPGTRVRVLPFARGAELSLDEGAATLAVVHRARARWAVLAGPFKVEVTGTRFSIHWSKSRQVLDVAVQEGEVRVSGGMLARATVLRAGQSLRADGPPPRSDAPREPVAPPPPAASAPTDGPAAGERPSTTRPRGVSRSSQRHTARNVASAAATRKSGVESADVAKPAAVADGSAQARSGPSAGPAPSSPASPAHRSWASASALGISAPKAASTTGLAASQVTLGSDSQLAGAMTGHTWLARGEGTTLSAPVVKEDHALLRPGKDGLCVSGTVVALRCASGLNVRCNWSQNWGVVVGFDVRSDGSAWGEDAARGIAVEFHGRSSRYRLNAHRKGDPPQKNYCIDNYKSGHMVTPSMFKSRCWDDEGEALPDFKSVDQFGLQFMAGMEYVAFHYCISGIRVDR